MLLEASLLDVDSSHQALDLLAASVDISLWATTHQVAVHYVLNVVYLHSPSYINPLRFSLLTHTPRCLNPSIIASNEFCIIVASVPEMALLSA